MEITDVMIRPVRSERELKAYVSITFDDCFVIHNIKIIEGRRTMFLAMPSRKTKTGEYKDIVHPLNSTFRTILRNKVLAAYQSSIEDKSSLELDNDVNETVSD